jgi:anti-anti-sigma factor
MVEFTFDATAKVLTCRLTARMDALNSQVVEKRLQEKLAEPDVQAVGRELRIVFDLCGVDYIASAFLRVCLSTAKKLEKGHFSMINCLPMVKKIFKISGFDKMFTIS